MRFKQRSFEAGGFFITLDRGGRKLFDGLGKLGKFVVRFAQVPFRALFGFRQLHEDRQRPHQAFLNGVQIRQGISVVRISFENLIGKIGFADEAAQFRLHGHIFEPARMMSELGRQILVDERADIRHVFPERIADMSFEIIKSPAPVAQERFVGEESALSAACRTFGVEDVAKPEHACVETRIGCWPDPFACGERGHHVERVAHGQDWNDIDIAVFERVDDQRSKPANPGFFENDQRGAAELIPDERAELSPDRPGLARGQSCEIRTAPVVPV